jgi:DNA polymerase III epsilon subunit-like protein
VSEPRPRIRVIDLETAGNGPHDVCEIGWQDFEQGDDGLWRLSDARGSRLLNPGRPISPETMAIHHILDEQVSGAPFWKAVAPEILRPEGGGLALAAHRAAFGQRYCRPHLTGGAGWICTWKGALRLWSQLPSFSNQRLRYQRRPEGLLHEMGLPAHGALPDAYVTAHHLRRLCQTKRRRLGAALASWVAMTRPADPFRYFNSSPEVIRLVVMMYVKFPLSLRNVEDLLHDCGIDLSYETVRYWWNRFGPMFAAEIRKKRVDYMRCHTHWKWHLDEMYVRSTASPTTSGGPSITRARCLNPSPPKSATWPRR